MDFSLVGIKEGLIKGLRVALWIAVSAAIAALIQACQDGTFGVDPLTMGIVNAVLVAVQKWVNTKK